MTLIPPLHQESTKKKKNQCKLRTKQVVLSKVQDYGSAALSFLQWAAQKEGNFSCLKGIALAYLLPLCHYYHKTAAFFTVANQHTINWTPQAHKCF